MRTVDAMKRAALLFSLQTLRGKINSLTLSDNINVMRLENRLYNIARDIVTGVAVSQEG